MEKTILPKSSWNIYLRYINYYLSERYGQKPSKDSQIWTHIPKEERKWISIDDLSNSLVLKSKKELYGLDLDYPLVMSGEEWLKTIMEARKEENYLNHRNIIVFDEKLTFIIFSLAEGDILVKSVENNILLSHKGRIYI